VPASISCNLEKVAMIVMTGGGGARCGERAELVTRPRI